MEKEDNNNKISQDLLNMELSHKNFLNSFKEISKYVKETPIVILKNPDKNGIENESVNFKQNVYLKLENFQPINSYKIRSCLNVCLNIKNNKEIYEFIRKNGIVTASAGNFSQGIAYSMNLLNFDCDLILAVPSTIPDIKLMNSKSYYNRVKVIKIKDKSKWYDIVKYQKFVFDNLGEVEVDGDYNSESRPMYICPTSHDLEILGTGSIPIEINNHDMYKDVDCFIVPWGGGGLAVGIAYAAKFINKNVKIYACECESANPLYASLEKGEPVEIKTSPSFIDGIGAPWVIEKNFNHAKKVIEKSLTCSVKEIAMSVKFLAENNKIIAEGAGACSVAAYFKYKDSELKNFKNIVCIISGGNIDRSKIIKILSEQYDDI